MKKKYLVIILCFMFVFAKVYSVTAAEINEQTDAVCYVETEDGKMYYATLESAISENNNVEIQMCNDADEELIVPAKKSFTIYANGYSVKGIKNNGDLLFDGGGCTFSSISSGTVSDTTYDRSYILIKNDADFELKNVKIEIDHKLTNDYVGTKISGFEVQATGIINNGTMSISDCDISVKIDTKAYYKAETHSIGIENQGKLETDNVSIYVYGSSSSTDDTYGVYNKIVGISNDSSENVIINNTSISADHKTSSTDGSLSSVPTTAISNIGDGQIEIKDSTLIVKSTNCSKGQHHESAGISNEGAGIVAINGGSLEVITIGGYNHGAHSYGIYNTNGGKIEVGNEEVTEISVVADYGHAYGVYNSSTGEKGEILINKTYITALVNSGRTVDGAYGVYLQNCDTTIGEKDEFVSLYPTIYGGLATFSGLIEEEDFKIYDGLFQSDTCITGFVYPEYYYPLICWYDNNDRICATLLNENDSIIKSVSNEKLGINIDINPISNNEEIILCKKTEDDTYPSEIELSNNQYLDSKVYEGKEYTYYVIKSVGEYVWVDQETISRITPSTDEPSTDEPSTDEPSTDEPSTDEPSTDEPVTPPIEQPLPCINVSYRTHIQSFGWEGNASDIRTWKSNGTMSGTSGKAKRLEGINIVVNSAEAGKNVDLGIQYTTHCQSYGWLPWSADGDMNGTEGEAKRLEAIKIQLTGADKDAYDVYYRVHAQSYGWLNWAKNGAPSGTAGYGKRLEGIQIVVVKNGETFNQNMEGITSVRTESYIAKEGSSPIVNYAHTSNANPIIPGADTPNVTYRTHVQSFGWQGWKYNGQMSGTSGLAKRLEGININLTNKPYDGDIVYTTHVQTYGWQGKPDDATRTGWKRNGQMSGTSGEAKRLEAICIDLTGEMAENYDIYYRVHAQSFGWLGWAKNGEESGTAGYAKRLEGIQIVLVPKGETAPANNYGGVTSNRTEGYIQK